MWSDEHGLTLVRGRSASRSGSPPSRSMFGTIRSTALGSHHAARPSRLIAAGTSTIRTSVTSSRTAAPATSVMAFNGPGVSSNGTPESLWPEACQSRGPAGTDATVAATSGSAAADWFGTEQRDPGGKTRRLDERSPAVARPVALVLCPGATPSLIGAPPDYASAASRGSSVCDPVLPVELLPEDWPGETLRTAYTNFAAELVARRDGVELMEAT